MQIYRDTSRPVKAVVPMVENQNQKLTLFKSLLWILECSVLNGHRSELLKQNQNLKRMKKIILKINKLRLNISHEQLCKWLF